MEPKEMLDVLDQIFQQLKSMEDQIFKVYGAIVLAETERTGTIPMPSI